MLSANVDMLTNNMEELSVTVLCEKPDVICLLDVLSHMRRLKLRDSSKMQVLRRHVGMLNLFYPKALHSSATWLCTGNVLSNPTVDHPVCVVHRLYLMSQHSQLH